MVALFSRMNFSAGYTRLADAASPLVSGEASGTTHPRSQSDATTARSAVELDHLAGSSGQVAPQSRPPAPKNLALAGKLRAVFRPQRPPVEDLESGPGLPPVPAEVLPNVYSHRKALKKFAGVGRRAALHAGAIGGSTALAHYLVLKSDPDNARFANGMLYGGASTASIIPAYKFLNGAYKAFADDARIFAIEAMQKNHDNDKAHFAEVQKRIAVPDYITLPAAMVDKLIDRDLARFEKAPAKITADELELTGRRRISKLNYITRRPSGIKAIEDWKTADGRGRMDVRVEQALADVNEADKVFVRLLVDRVCSTSVAYQHYQAAALPETPHDQRLASGAIDAYRQRGANFIVTGNPGVGKTYTIKEVLEKAVNAKVIEITIPSDEDGGFATLLPKDWDVLNQTGFVPKPQDILGTIIQALMEGQCENIVLYFNEVNARSALTIDGFKRLLDRTNEFIKNTPLATMFHVAPVTIIIDLNPTEENEKFLSDPAVIDRCIVHEWSPAVTVGLAAKRLRAAFEDNSKASCLPINNDRKPDQPHPPVLTPIKQTRLRNIFNEVFETLLREHRLTTGSARTEFVGMLVPYIANSLRRNVPIGGAQIKEYIRKHYATLREAQTQTGRPVAEVEAEVTAWLSEQKKAGATPPRAETGAAHLAGPLLPEVDPHQQQ